MNKTFILIVLFAIVTSCGLFSRVYIVYPYDVLPNTRNHNTCKELKDSVIIYAIFVDVDIYHPWTEFDIASTKDSIAKATLWIENRAQEFNRHVYIKTVHHEQGKKLSIYEKSAKVYPLAVNGLTIKSKRKYKNLRTWANGISRYAGKSIDYKSSNQIHKRLKIESVQELNLALRDKFQNENVAIMFFVNGYYENHPSLSFNTNTTTQKVEYSIITNKNPSVIAHEFLHLFGAVDLYQNMNYPNFNYAEINENYPNEIMNIQYKDINHLMISPITAYFIGWQDSLDYKNNRLLFHKIKAPVYN
jgi:hypothetical protein